MTELAKEVCDGEASPLLVPVEREQLGLKEQSIQGLCGSSTGTKVPMEVVLTSLAHGGEVAKKKRAKGGVGQKDRGGGRR